MLSFYTVVHFFIVLFFNFYYQCAFGYKTGKLSSYFDLKIDVPISDEKAKRISNILEQSFARIARDEMGVMAMQAAFDGLTYKTLNTKSSSTDFDKLFTQFTNSLREYTHIVTGTKAISIRLYRSHLENPITPRFDCCNLSDRDLKLDLVYGCRISRRKCCDLIPHGLTSEAFNPGHNLTERFRKQLDYWPSVKWFYFITAQGLHTEYPAHNFQCAANSDIFPNKPVWYSNNFQEMSSDKHYSTYFPISIPYHCYNLNQFRHRATFVRSIMSQPIWMVIILDLGEVSQTQLMLGQRLARLLVSSLSERDHIAVLLVSNNQVQRAPTSSNQSQFERDIFDSSATDETKLVLDQFINSVRNPLAIQTNHSQGLQHAFEIFGSRWNKKGELNNSMNNMMIAYISRGHLGNLNESTHTLRLVAKEQAKFHNRIFINSYMLVEEKSSTILFEQTFMKDLATRWSIYSQPSINNLSQSNVARGQFFSINRTTDLLGTVGQFYKNVLPSYSKSVINNNKAKINATSNYTEPRKNNNEDDATVELVDTNDHSAFGDNESYDTSGSVEYSLPHHDLEGGDVVVSISQAFYDRAILVGVMGIDIRLFDLIDHLVHYSGGPSDGGAGSRVNFLIHTPGGYTLYHPHFAQFARLPNDFHDRWKRRRESSNYANRRSAFVSKPARPILNPDIGELERIPGFQSLVRPRLLNESNGEMGLLVTLTIMEMELYGLTGIMNTCQHLSHLRNQTDLRTRIPLRLVYRWKRVAIEHGHSTPFVLVQRSVESSCAETRELLDLVPDFDFRYHRLDLLNQPQKCIYLNQLATFSHGTIYLAPRAFAKPFHRLTKGYLENLNEVRHLITYLFDQNVLISNPDLADSTPSVRSSVAIVERIGKFWGHRGHVSESKDYIVRRYVATNTGVMLVYPGTRLAHTYDPTQSIWYKRALALPGRVVATGPYLDTGGAGQIITLSRTIFEGNHTGIHQIGIDKITAVIGMDISYRFLSLILSQWLPECGQLLHKNESNVSEMTNPVVSNVTSNTTQWTNQKRCFLMDDRGYLMAHPKFYNAQQNEPIERNHITYLEPNMAADLLNYDEFVHKSTCLDYNERKFQRYYVFNLLHNELIGNHKSRSTDQCMQYQLLSIPMTNLYFGVIIDQTKPGCNPRTAFCPCSKRNRLCLNCGRMEPAECECPCECPKFGSIPASIFHEHVHAYLTTSNQSTEYIVQQFSTDRMSEFDSNPLSVLTHFESNNAVNYLPCPTLLQSDFSLDSNVVFYQPAQWKMFPNLQIPHSSLPTCSMNSERFDHLLGIHQHHHHHHHQSSSCPKADSEFYAAFHDLASSNLMSGSRCLSRGRLTCSSTVGCEWCLKLYHDSFRFDATLTKLDKPFCASIGTCFNGVLGSANPYGSRRLDSDWSSKRESSNRRISYSIKHRESIELLKSTRLQSVNYNREDNDDDDDDDVDDVENIRLASNPNIMQNYNLLALFHNKRPSRRDSGLLASLIHPSQHQLPSWFDHEDGSRSAHLSSSSTASTANNPIGSVAGAVLASMILFVLFIYFLKYQRRLRRTFIISSAHNSNTGNFDQARLNQSGLDHVQPPNGNQQSSINNSHLATFNVNGLFDTTANANLRSPPPPPPPSAAVVTAYAATSSGVLTADEDDESVRMSKSARNLSTSDLSAGPSDESQVTRHDSGSMMTNHWDQQVMEKVKLLIDTYSNAESSTMPGNETDLGGASSTDNQTSVQCIGIPNPYHTNPMQLHFVPNSTAFNNHEKAIKVQSCASEPDDSALGGSDCATSVSCNSSNSKTGSQADKIQANNPPLGVCIGTLILGPTGSCHRHLKPT